MFRRDADGLVAEFSADEARVLRHVVSEILTLLGTGFDRDDPVVERLFPDVYPDDPREAAEYRRYTEGDLKSGKVEQVGKLLASLPVGGGLVRLDEETAEAWLRALTDVRLALGIRLDLADDTDLEEELDEAVLRDPTSPRVAQLTLYSYLTYLQESLVGSLAGW